MHQLTGLDAAFLALDTPTSSGHVASLSILKGDVALTLDDLATVFSSRRHLVPLLTRRLVDVPLGIDQPYWIEDPAFDVEFHVRELALPSPGSDQQLAEQAARLHARPLDRRRPLWEAYLIHGLAGGRQALYTKIHHAAIDGASGAEALGLLLDTDPDATSGAPQPRTLEDVPGAIGLFARGVLNLGSHPARAVRMTSALVGASPAIVRLIAWPAVAGSALGRSLRRDEDLILVRPAQRPPATPFNAKLTPHRRWAFRSVSLDDVKQVRAQHQVTVNDVVMAVCAGALRRWLLERDALPQAPLVAAAPISVRTEEEKGAFGNSVSMLFAPLPTHLADPLARLMAVTQSMGVAKAQHAAIPGRVLSDVTQFSMPAVAARAARLSARLGLTRYVNAFNLTISNVPGPRVPLYLAGAELMGTYPLSALADGQGLNITITGYRDVLGFGLLACRELVPDVEHLGDLLCEELEVLLGTSRSSAGEVRRDTGSPAAVRDAHRGASCSAGAHGRHLLGRRRDQP